MLAGKDLPVMVISPPTSAVCGVIARDPGALVGVVKAADFKPVKGRAGIPTISFGAFKTVVTVSAPWAVYELKVEIIESAVTAISNRLIFLFIFLSIY